MGFYGYYNKPKSELEKQYWEDYNNRRANLFENHPQVFPNSVFPVYNEYGSKISFDYENGNLIKATLDNDGDKKPDRIDTYAYDDEGNLINETRDTNGDGKPDAIRTIVYDDKGKPIEDTCDTNGDGKPDVTRTYKHYNFWGATITEDETKLEPPYP